MEASLSLAALPTEDRHFKGRYRLWLGLVFLLLGLLTTGLNTWVMLLNGQFSGAVVLGLLITLIGILYLKQPYFAIAPNRLTLYNLIGRPVKRYSFESFSQLSIEGSTLYLKDRYLKDNTDAMAKTKVNLTRWMMKSADWQRIEAISQELSQA